jgi:hypothetical protein
MERGGRRLLIHDNRPWPFAARNRPHGGARDLNLRKKKSSRARVDDSSSSSRIRRRPLRVVRQDESIAIGLTSLAAQSMWPPTLNACAKKQAARFLRTGPPGEVFDQPASLQRKPCLLSRSASCSHNRWPERRRHRSPSNHCRNRCRSCCSRSHHIRIRHHHIRSSSGSIRKPELACTRCGARSG